MVAKGWKEKRMGSDCAWVQGLWNDENGLELGSHEGCTTLILY